MAPSLTPKDLELENEKPIAEPPQHQDTTDSESNGDGKSTPLSPHHEADKEDGEEKVNVSEDDKDGKSLLPHGKSDKEDEEEKVNDSEDEEEETDSEDEEDEKDGKAPLPRDKDETDSVSDGDGKPTALSPHNKADKEDKEDKVNDSEDEEEETDSEDEEDKKDGKAPLPHDKPDEEEVTDSEDDEDEKDGKALSPHDKAGEKEVNDSDDEEDDNDGKALPPHDKADKEEVNDSKEADKDGKALPPHDKADEEETDSEDEKDGKGLSPYDKEDEEEETDSDDTDDEKDGKLIEKSPSDKGEEKADSENDDEEVEIDEISKALQPSDKAENETYSRPSDKAENETNSRDEEELTATHAQSQLVAIENNGSGDLGATIPKPLKIIPGKRIHAELTDGQQLSPKINKKPKPLTIIPRKRTHAEMTDGQQSPERAVVQKNVSTLPLRWRDDDEVVLVKGMDKYNNKKGLDFKSDLAGFHIWINGKFQVGCTKEQLRNKIRNLKKRFERNENRGVNDGSDPSFFKQHDRLVFEISKKVWGADGSISNDSKSDSVKRQKILRVCDKTNEGVSFWSRYAYLGCLFDQLSTVVSPRQFSKMKDKMSLIDSEVAKEINRECKQLIRDESELIGKMTDLIRDVLKRDG